MGVYAVRPPVCNLIFQLYGRPVHPELFDILAVRKLQHQDYQLTVWITRTGHVITWENADVLLTEVTPAADQELPNPPPPSHSTFRPGPPAHPTGAHGVPH